jgi:hypothetical protein
MLKFEPKGAAAMIRVKFIWGLIGLGALSLVLLVVLPVVGQDSTGSIKPSVPYSGKPPSTSARGTSDRIVLAGEIVIPKGDIALRAEPPGTFFKPKGQEVGSVHSTESYIVLDSATIPTVTGMQHWIKVQALTDRNREGWIYNGNGTTKANVIPSK